ncbi:unnamed protein product [Adineta steineri]|uniref:Uncharacterized protein n=1 Tax=Adineta steineri TaxID=433720 RepID=A0A813YUU3_9BILA|nr:unnamed protein product [Adineta steineri]CAF3589546.1 unnamed protein product [Adineta steineri]
MLNYSSIIFISIYLLLLIKCHTVQSRKLKGDKEHCTTNRSNTHFQVCHLHEIPNYSDLIWFTIESSLQDTFDSFRFILRPIEDILISDVNIEILTNFTQLIDFNNSLRIYNLDKGLYEVCVEFQSNITTTFIYKPRDGCISLRVGSSLHESFKQSSTPLLIALASGIVLFFILGLVVQRVKAKRAKQDQNDTTQRSRSSTILSTISLKQQRDRLVRNLFHHHFEQPRVSRMRQWARSRAFRHRISIQEQEPERPTFLRRWSKNLLTSIDQLSQPRSRTETMSHERIASSDPCLTTDHIYTISNNEQHQMPPRKISFHLSPPEEYEMV